MSNVYGKMKVKDINTQFQALPDGTNHERQVRTIVALIRSGEKMPPILVSPTGYLQDGRHRLAAYKRLGYEEVDVEIGYHPAAKVTKKKGKK